MSRLLFVSAPLPGHMDWGGMHRTAALLTAQGHHVRWATEEAGFHHLRALGIEPLPLPTTGWLWPPPPIPKGLSPQERARERERRAISVWLDPERVLPATRALVDLVSAEKPNVLVTEPFIAAAGFAAELTQTRLVVIGWPATEMPTRIPPQQAEAARLAQRWFKEMKAALGVQGTYWAPGPLPWLRSPHAHITYFTRTWYGAWRILVPPTYFVGGRPHTPSTPPPGWMQTLPADRPAVLITLGSVFTQDEAFFHVALQAVLEVGAYPIVATGDEKMAARLRASYGEGARVETWVSFAHLFPRLALVIHHGGVGTTHAALVHGIPQFIVPHAADQYYQAARVQRTGVGVALRAQQITPTLMRTWIRDLLNEPTWRERAQKVATEMAALGGIERAARILVDVATSS